MAYTSEEGIRLPNFTLSLERSTTGKYSWKCKINAQSIDELMTSAKEVRKRIFEQIKGFEKEEK